MNVSGKIFYVVASLLCLICHLWRRIVELIWYSDMCLLPPPTCVSAALYVRNMRNGTTCVEAGYQDIPDFEHCETAFHAVAEVPATDPQFVRWCLCVYVCMCTCAYVCIMCVCVFV